MTEKSYAHITIFDDKLYEELNGLNIEADEVSLVSDRHPCSMAITSEYSYKTNLENGQLKFSDDNIRMINYISQNFKNSKVLISVIVNIYGGESNKIFISDDFISNIGNTMCEITFDIYRYDYYNERWNTKMRVYYDCENKYSEYGNCLNTLDNIKFFLEEKEVASSCLNVCYKRFVDSKVILTIDDEVIVKLKNRKLSVSLTFE